MDDMILAPTVSERHVDFLLEEEFCVNPEFLRKFVAAADQNLAPPLQIVDVHPSLSDQHGEADLVVRYKAEGNKTIALLIEDKIRAVFQPKQALRYQDRGKAGIPNEWDEYRTCLVGPESYVKGVQGFDAVLYLQVLKEWIA